jgi:hypothetical protein
VATASQLVSKKVCHCSAVSVPNRKDRKDQMPSWAVSTANWLMQLIPPSLTGSSPLLDETFSLSTSSCHGFTQEPGAKTLGKIILIYEYVICIYIIYYVIFLCLTFFRFLDAWFASLGYTAPCCAEFVATALADFAYVRPWQADTKDPFQPNHKQIQNI